VRRAGVVLVALAAGCTVPDKFLSETDGGGDDVDAAGDDEPDAGLDTTPPETTITSAPPDDSDAGLATFEFEADEDATFLCSIDGETPDDCESPYSRSLTDGPHTFSVRAVDLAGNQDETPAEHLWNIDTVDPDTTITVAPAAVDNSTMASFEFTSNEANVTFECSENGGTFTACVSPHDVGPLTDGSYTFGVRAVDAAGNSDTSPDTHAWMVDTSTPDTTILSGPSGSVASTSASFTFTSPDAGAGATFECSLDGAAFTTCTTGIAYSPLSEASHTFQVRVRDAGGNLDPTPATRTWTVDVTAPTTSITAAPSGSVNVASANITFSSNEAGTFQCSLDGGGFSTCSTPHPLTGLSQGSHTFQVRAVDAAGNQDASPASATWTVDTIAPDTSIASGPPSPDDDTAVSFDFSSNESPVTYQCSLNLAAFTSCADPVTITVGDGANSLRVRATDAAGNQDSTPATHSWTTDTTAPVVTFSQAPNNGATTGPYVTFAWTVDDPLATVTCTLNGTMVGCASPYSVNIAAGAANFKVEARDQFSRVGTGERSWTVACAPSSLPTQVLSLGMNESGTTQTIDNAEAGYADANFGPGPAVELGDPVRQLPGRFGQAMRFLPGDYDMVGWYPSLGPALYYGVDLWFSPGDYTGLSNLFSISGGGIRLNYQRFANNTIIVTLNIQTGSSTYTVDSAAVSAPGWHHVLATANATESILWLDGVRYSIPYTGSSGFSFSQTYIGGDSTQGNGFDGLIDEVHVSYDSVTDAVAHAQYCPPPAPTTVLCPASYTTTLTGGHRYRNVTTTSGWQSAYNDCADDLPGYTYVAVPDNNAELQGIVTQHGGNRWVGVDDAQMQGDYRTVRGEYATFLPWEPGQPNGGMSESQVYVTGSNNYRDDSPSNPHSYTCECDGN
jgi:hypothetical protein